MEGSVRRNEGEVEGRAKSERERERDAPALRARVFRLASDEMDRERIEKSLEVERKNQERIEKLSKRGLNLYR